jgi:hypothetical protein
MPQAKEVAESLETKTATQPQIPTEVLQSPKVAVTPVPLTKKDEKLVALAATMLIIVVMLLAYMYSVGRL